MQLSIVTTMYCSGQYVEEFYSRICAVAKSITDNFEIIFVNDGSPDNALDLAIEIQKKDSKVKLIDLSRNFGHHKAMMTGLAHARGENIFLIDIDLEEEPEWLERFWHELNESDHMDMVYGIQERRKGGFFERSSGALFNIFFNLFSDVKLDNNQTVARLMSKRYVHSLLQFTERELVFAGLCELTGYNQGSIFVQKGSKASSTYNLFRKAELAINYITSFSSKPLALIFYLGLVVTCAASFFALKTLFIKIVYGIPVEGWTSIIISIWFLGGILMFSLGILGIYLSKIFIEVKRRPYTIIRAIYERDDEI